MAPTTTNSQHHLQHHSSDPIKDIQGSGNHCYGFMTTNTMAFGPDLLMSAKLSASGHPKIGMAWHTLAIMSQHHSAASFIRPIQYSPIHSLRIYFLLEIPVSLIPNILQIPGFSGTIFISS
jgi:hypothetical protein